MKCMHCRDWSSVSAAVAGVLMLGLSLPGCAPQPEAKQKAPPPEAKKTAAAAEQEATAKSEAKPAAAPKPETKVEPPAPPPAAPAPPPAAPEPKSPAKPADAPAGAANMSPPKVSSFAPAEDLVFQMDKYLAQLQNGTVDEAAYKDKLSDDEVSQTGSTMVLLAVALGSSDQDNKYKANAAALLAACQKLATATGYAATKQAVEGVAAAAKGEGKGDAEVKWAKLADLKKLMKQVPDINIKLGSNIKRLRTKAKEAGGNSATLAVIAQGSMANVSDTIKPAESKKWFEYCADMREAAAAVNAGVHAQKEKAVSDGMDRLQKTCEPCHDVFKPKTAP